MKKLVAFTLTSLCIGAPACFSATLNSLNKDEFIQAFVNKTSHLTETDKQNGQTIQKTFSIFVDDKGNVIGKLLDGAGKDPKTDEGSYSIDDDGTVYVTWKHWEGGKKLCFHSFATNNAYLNVDCDNAFRTVIMKDAIKSGNHLK